MITVTLASKKNRKSNCNRKNDQNNKAHKKYQKTLSLTTGKKYTLKPVVTPSILRRKLLTRAKNTKIATVSGTGVITAKKSEK